MSIWPFIYSFHFCTHPFFFNLVESRVPFNRKVYSWTHKIGYLWTPNLNQISDQCISCFLAFSFFCLFVCFCLFVFCCCFFVCLFCAIYDFCCTAYLFFSGFLFFTTARVFKLNATIFSSLSLSIRLCFTVLNLF